MGIHQSFVSYGGASVPSDLTTSLISAWELDEASGNALDSHGTNELTDTNTVGTSGGWRDFERSNTEYFTIADNTDLSTGNIDFTFETWVNMESDANYLYILSKYNAGASQGEYELYYNQGIDRFTWRTSYDGTSSVWIDSGSALSIATPYQIICWHDSVGNQIGIQVNNGTPATTSQTAGVFNSTASFQIGTEQGSDPFDGLIRRTRMWKRLLTTDEKTFLYNSGTGRAYSEF